MAILFCAEIFVSRKSTEIKPFCGGRRFDSGDDFLPRFLRRRGIVRHSRDVRSVLLKSESPFYMVLIFIAFLPRVLFGKTLDIFPSFDAVTPLIFLSTFAYLYKTARKFDYADVVVKLAIALSSILLCAFAWRECEGKNIRDSVRIDCGVMFSGGILRVISFGVLGFVLMGIGWVYSKWIFKIEKNRLNFIKM